MFKSSGQVGVVDRVRELRKKMNARGWQSSPMTFGCMTVALVMTHTTVLKGFAVAKLVKEVFSTYEEMKHRGIDLNSSTCFFFGCAVLEVNLEKCAPERGNTIHTWKSDENCGESPAAILAGPRFCQRRSAKDSCVDGVSYCPQTTDLHTRQYYGS